MPEGAGIRVREETGLVEDELAHGREVIDSGPVAVLPEPLACHRIPFLRELPEGKERLMAPCSRSRRRYDEDLLRGQVRRTHARWRLGKRAIAAPVATQHRERDEHLR